MRTLILATLKREPKGTKGFATVWREYPKLKQTRGPFLHQVTKEVQECKIDNNVEESHTPGGARVGLGFFRGLDWKKFRQLYFGRRKMALLNKGNPQES